MTRTCPQCGAGYHAAHAHHCTAGASVGDRMMRAAAMYDVAKANAADAPKHDAGKARIGLIPVEAILGLAEHFTRGASKYPEDNGRSWERGIAYERMYNAAQRHLLAWWGGEDNDPETGSSHALACAWNALCLYVLHKRGHGTDDRPSKVKP